MKRFVWSVSGSHRSCEIIYLVRLYEAGAVAITARAFSNPSPPQLRYSTNTLAKLYIHTGIRLPEAKTLVMTGIYWFLLLY